MPDETGMEQVQSDLKALKVLYGLLHNGSVDEYLDKTSRDYLMRMLDDATEKALLRQAKMISGSLMPPALERNLSIRSDRQTRPAADPPRPSLNPPSLSLHQASERLHRLTLHHSPSSSRGVHGPCHAAEEPPVLSRLPSNRSSRTAKMPPPRQQPTTPTRQQPSSSAALRPRLDDTLHRSTSSTSRGGRDTPSHHRRAAKVPPVLSRLPSNRSSRTTAMLPPLRHHESRQQPNYSGLSLYRLPVAATSQHGTVTGRSPRADELRDTTRRRVYGDHSSLERGSTRRSVSGKLSLVRDRQPVSVSSTRHLGRLGSGLSLGVASRRGSERSGRGVAMATPRPNCSTSASSSNGAATIRSRIMPHNRELTARFLQRAAAEVETTPRRRRRAEDDAVSSGVGSRPRGALHGVVDSGRSYTVSSPGAASYRSSGSFTYATSRTASSTASASSYSYSSSPPPVPRRPAYASADSSRSRRRRERRERRKERVRRFKEKIAMVFHHRHDHHHHHHHHQQQQQQHQLHAHEASPPLLNNLCVRDRKSTWKQLGGLFNRAKRQEKKATASHAAVSVPPPLPKKKKRGGGGGGGMGVLFGGMRHLRGKRKAPVPASVKKMRKMATRAQGNKVNWWQQLRKRHAQPRRRLSL
ncbi:hypothetical protein QOZ80_4AG0305050 [Eleusine coracana subsp. coracana]|nr:hypothetical protein QOZ80_4AG0305050 [Eleusine coracana subsp. coracana]